MDTCVCTHGGVASGTKKCNNGDEVSIAAADMEIRGDSERVSHVVYTAFDPLPLLFCAGLDLRRTQVQCTPPARTHAHSSRIRVSTQFLDTEIVGLQKSKFPVVVCCCSGNVMVGVGGAGVAAAAATQTERERADFLKGPFFSLSFPAAVACAAIAAARRSRRGTKKIQGEKMEERRSRRLGKVFAP